MKQILDAQRARARSALETSRAAVERLRELRLIAEAAATPCELLHVSSELPGQLADLAHKL